MERKFSLSEDHAPKAGLTISTRETESGSVGVTYFSLGGNTDISAERYPEDVLYLGNFGSGEFRLRNAVEDKEKCGRLQRGLRCWSEKIRSAVCERKRDSFIRK